MSNVPSQIGAAAQAIVNQAKRLGLTWELRPATVQSADSVQPTVILDGDTAIVPAITLTGYVASGDRVMILITPPSGMYVVGFVKPTPQVRTYTAENSTQTALTTSIVDLPGTTLTVVAGAAGAVWRAHGVFDFNASVTGYGTAIGYLNVDGAAAAGQALLAAGVIRVTTPQMWEGEFDEPGEYTFKLQVQKTVNAGTVAAMNIHTKYHVTVYEPRVTT